MRPVASSTSTRAPASAPSADRARVSSSTRRAARVDERRRGRRRPRRARPRRAPCARRARRRAGGSTPAARATVDDLPARVDLERVRATRTAGGASSVRAADLDADRRGTPRSRRSAAASARAARRPPGRRPPAPGRPSAVGELLRRARARRVRPCRRTRRRWRAGVAGSPPGAHQLASGSRYAGSTQLVASAHAAVGHVGQRRAAARSSTVVRRPCTLPARVRASSSESPRPSRARPRRPSRPSDPGGHGTATDARRRARGRRRTRRRPCGTAGPTRCAAPPSSSARRPAASRSRATPATLCVVRTTGRGDPTTKSGASGEVEGLVDGLPAGAAAEVGGEGAVDVGAARSCPSPRARRGAR